VLAMLEQGQTFPGTIEQQPDDVIHEEYDPTIPETSGVKAFSSWAHVLLVPRGRPLMRCHHCSSRFGSVRHQLITFRGWIFFCSSECKDDFCKWLQRNIRKRKFRDGCGRRSAVRLRTC
jgi:hypothetical protein